MPNVQWVRATLVSFAAKAYFDVPASFQEDRSFFPEWKGALKQFRPFSHTCFALPHTDPKKKALKYVPLSWFLNRIIQMFQ